MLSIHSSRLRNSAAILALVLSGAPAIAQQVAANATNITSTTSAGEVETLVVTGTAFDPETAPAKSSLDTMEPQTIISKSYIQDSVPPPAPTPLSWRLRPA